MTLCDCRRLAVLALIGTFTEGADLTRVPAFAPQKRCHLCADKVGTEMKRKRDHEHVQSHQTSSVNESVRLVRAKHGKNGRNTEEFAKRTEDGEKKRGTGSGSVKCRNKGVVI